MPCYSMELDKLSESVWVWAAALVCLLICPVGGLSVWAVIVTIVGSCVIARLYMCWAALGSIAIIMPWLAQLQLIVWMNEHSSCSRWESCIRTFCSVHLVDSLSICSRNSWSRAWMSLFGMSVISLKNVACFCRSWSKPSRFFHWVWWPVEPVVTADLVGTLWQIGSFYFPVNLFKALHCFFQMLGCHHEVDCWGFCAWFLAWDYLFKMDCHG